jgi:hypothetical protein
MRSSKKAPNPARNHHYLPQCLLKHFADDNGMLWEYDTETSAVEQRHIKDAGYERDLYTIAPDGENPDFQSIEIEMGKIENAGARAIQHLLQRKHLSRQSRISFIQFVAVLHHRTPAFFERFETYSRALAFPV